MNAKECNRRSRSGQAAASKLEPSLRDKYEASLRANAKRIAKAYRDTGIVAAGKVPTLDEVLRDAALSASVTARTKVERQRIAEAAAHPIISDMGKQALRALLEPIVAAQAGVQAERIVAGVRDRVAAIMLDALTEGLSVPETARILQAQLELDAAWQAEMLARTDLISLSNAGSHKAAVELDDGPKFKVWLSAGDDRVRPTHVDANGQVVAIDSPYKLSEGVELQYPGDPAGPDGEVINCRCVSVFTDTATATLAHSDAGGIHDEPITQFDAPVTAAGFDESKVARYAKGTRVVGKEGGGRFAPKHGASSSAVQAEAQRAATAAQKADAEQLTLEALTAERSIGRDIRLTGKLADGKVYRVSKIEGVGTKGNTLVHLEAEDGSTRKVFGFVEVEDVSGGFEQPGTPVAPPPPGEPTTTLVPGPDEPAPPATPDVPVAPPEPEPVPEPPKPPPPPEKPVQPAPPPVPPPFTEPPDKPIPLVPTDPVKATVPGSPAVNKPIKGSSLKPGEKFRDLYGREHTVVGPYKPRPRTYFEAVDENGRKQLFRKNGGLYVDPGHPALAREAKTLVSHVPGEYGKVFNKTPAATNVITEAAGAASLEASKVLTLPDDMPKIELKETRSQTAGGQYWSRGAKPERITLRKRNADEMISTMHHETGHYLDHGVLGPMSRIPAGEIDTVTRLGPYLGDRSGLYASSVRHPEVMGPVMDAIDASEAVKRIETMVRAPAGQFSQVANPGTSFEKMYSADRKHSRYLAEPTEKWARAYEQYQSRKAKQREWQYEEGAALPLSHTNLEDFDQQKAFYGWYWTDEDFAPIEKEIDAMFGRLGWSKS